MINISKNRELKHFLIISTIIVLLACFIMQAVLRVQNKQYRYELNKEISAILGVLEESNPEAKHEIVKELSNVNEENIAKRKRNFK